MIERKEQERRTTELVIATVTCDRCGEPARHMSGIGVPVTYEFEGVYIKGTLYPSSNAADAQYLAWQLCGRCSRALHEWIGSDGDASEGLDATR